jgi:hypothetical protein
MFKLFSKEKKPDPKELKDMTYRELLEDSFIILEKVPDTNSNKERIRHKLKTSYRDRVTVMHEDRLRSLRSQLIELNRRIRAMAR